MPVWSKSTRLPSSGTTACAHRPSRSSPSGLRAIAVFGSSRWIASTKCCRTCSERRKDMPTTDTSTTITTRGELEIVQERVFDAPRELVFTTLHDPDLIPKWWGPSYLTTTVEKMDVRPGGAWRYVQRAPDGGEHA